MRNIQLEPSFWQNKNHKIGIALANYPAGGAHRSGPEGLLDMAINRAASSDFDTYFRTLTPQEFSAFPDRLAERLQAMGFSATRIPTNLHIEQFPKLKDGPLSNDFRQLATTYDIDMLLLLSVEKFGTIRYYQGFISMGAPKGLFQAKGQLIDLRSNALRWQAAMREDEGATSIDGEWPPAPDYTKFVDAMRRSERGAIYFLETRFFESLPQP
jgi:hypothetical protein